MWDSIRADMRQRTETLTSIIVVMSCHANLTGNALNKSHLGHLLFSGCNFHWLRYVLLVSASSYVSLQLLLLCAAVGTLSGVWAPPGPPSLDYFLEKSNSRNCFSPGWFTSKMNPRTGYVCFIRFILKKEILLFHAQFTTLLSTGPVSGVERIRQRCNIPL